MNKMTHNYCKINNNFCSRNTVDHYTDLVCDKTFGTDQKRCKSWRFETKHYFQSKIKCIKRVFPSQLDLYNQITYERYCPLMASYVDDWIYQSPIVIVLLINSMFLVKIMWVSKLFCFQFDTYYFFIILSLTL